MTRKILYLILPLLLLIFVSTTNAQTTTGSAQTTSDSATRLKQQLQEIQAQRKTAVSEIKQEAKTKRVELKKQIRETVRAKREEFKVKLQAIKDEKKRALVNRIDAKLIAVNTKHTDRFTQVLSNLQIILDKITEDIDKTEAKNAIDAAVLAVENQAAKTYTIEISTETALRSDVGTVTSQLRQDLVATHKLVVDAKQAVQALRAENAMIKKEATSSASL